MEFRLLLQQNWGEFWPNVLGRCFAFIHQRWAARWTKEARDMRHSFTLFHIKVCMLVLWLQKTSFFSKKKIQPHAFIFIILQTGGIDGFPLIQNVFKLSFLQIKIEIRFAEKNLHLATIWIIELFMISDETTVRGAPLRSEEVFKECSELSPKMIESKLRKMCYFEILVLPPQHPSLIVDIKVDIFKTKYWFS